jgi:hypothetical protein
MASRNDYEGNFVGTNAAVSTLQDSTISRLCLKSKSDLSVTIQAMPAGVHYIDKEYNTEFRSMIRICFL